MRFPSLHDGIFIHEKESNITPAAAATDEISITK
jgi:hypothetical protein